jgi:hypothetical protein
MNNRQRVAAILLVVILALLAYEFADGPECVGTPEECPSEAQQFFEFFEGLGD